MALAKKLCDDFPDEPKYLLEVAWVETDVGIALGTRAYFTESMEHYQLGLKYLETYSTRFPQAPKYPGTEAKIHQWLGTALQGLNRLADAEQHISQALTMRKQLAVERPETDDDDLPHIKSYLASVLKWDRPREAIQLLRETAAGYEKFQELNPDSFDIPRRLQSARRQLADLLLDVGQLDDAEALYHQALKFDLKSKEPIRTSLEGGSSLAANYYGLGKVLDKGGHSLEAAEHFARAVAVLDDLVNRNTNSLASQSQLAGILLKCPQKSFQNPVRAAQLLATCLRLAPRSQSVWMLLGVAQLKNGQTAEAISSLRRSVEITGIGAADQWLYLAMALHQAGEKAEARQWYDKAVVWMEKTRTQDSGYLLLRREAALLIER